MTAHYGGVNTNSRIRVLDMANQPDIVNPLALPVATTNEIPGRATVRYVGPTFGVIARSMGFVKGFTGGFKALKKVGSRSSPTC